MDVIHDVIYKFLSNFFFFLSFFIRQFLEFQILREKIMSIKIKF